MPETELDTQMRRVSTGDAGLDAILKGGFFAGGVYVLAGAPGAGKTTLANQLCFAEVNSGGRAVYVTLLAETHGRIVSHLRSLSFFDQELVGDRLLYVSGVSAIEKDGAPGLLSLINKTVREHKATVLVIDGIGPIAEKSGSELAFRQLLHNLGAHASLANCTTLLLTSQMTEKPHDRAQAVADGIVELAHSSAGMWTVRTIEVTKFRGSETLQGRHLFDIRQDGLRVFPRIESLYMSEPTVVPDAAQRLGFGVRRLDQMLRGGLVSYSSTLLFGSPGSGKTLLGLHFLHDGAVRGERGLHISFSETAARLVAKGRMVGLDIGPDVSAGLTRLEMRAATETLPDQLASDILTLVREHGAKRVFIDGMEPLSQQPLDEGRRQRFLTALLGQLLSCRATVVATQQTNTMFGGDLHPPVRDVEAIVDNVIFLRYFELRSQLYRMLSVLKTRESDCDHALREFSISSDGLDVAATFQSAEAILTGQPRASAASKRHLRSTKRKGK